MRETQHSVSSPDRGEAGGQAKDDQMCSGISSKEVTTTARKTESELPGAKLEGEKNLKKPLTTLIWRRKSTEEKLLVSTA